MSTASLNDLKINTKDYTEEYTKNFNQLITQTDKDRSHKIDKIISNLIDKNIFEINGDDDFKKRIYNDIRVLLQVKPGRFLFKELIKSVEFYSEDKSPIKIKSGKKSFHNDDGSIEINSNESEDRYYNALSGSNTVKCSRPTAITLAHELIHHLHKRDRDLQEIAEEYARLKQKKPISVPDFIKDVKIYPKFNFKEMSCPFEGFENQIIFKGLDTLEEEHTILGVNFPRFLQKKTINKLDVLCENAFLVAFNLLPRIDHQDAGNTVIDDAQTNQPDLFSYYGWLSQKINERNDRLEMQFGYLN